jgi:general stress protein 26
MAATPEVKLKELALEFGVGMLVTRTPEGRLRARPMAVAEVGADGCLWFVTDRHAGKMAEIGRDGQVAVTMQSSTKFVSLSGRAIPVEDRAKAAALWKAEFQVWFPKGKDDPDLILVRVDATEGEYWDNSGTGGLKYLIQAGRALLTGMRPDVGRDPKVHGKVDL